MYRRVPSRTGEPVIAAAGCGSSKVDHLKAPVVWSMATRNAPGPRVEVRFAAWRIVPKITTPPVTRGVVRETNPVRLDPASPACVSRSPTFFDQTAMPVAALILLIMPPQSGT